MFAVSLDVARGSTTAVTANVMRRARNVIRISSIDFILPCVSSVYRQALIAHEEVSCTQCDAAMLRHDLLS